MPRRVRPRLVPVSGTSQCSVSGPGVWHVATRHVVRGFGRPRRSPFMGTASTLWHPAGIGGARHRFGLVTGYQSRCQTRRCARFRSRSDTALFPVSVSVSVSVSRVSGTSVGAAGVWHAWLVSGTSLPAGVRPAGVWHQPAKCLAPVCQSASLPGTILLASRCPAPADSTSGQVSGTDRAGCLAPNPAGAHLGRNRELHLSASRTPGFCPAGFRTPVRHPAGHERGDATFSTTWRWHAACWRRWYGKNAAIRARWINGRDHDEDDGWPTPVEAERRAQQADQGRDRSRYGPVSGVVTRVRLHVEPLARAALGARCRPSRPVSSPRERKCRQGGARSRRMGGPGLGTPGAGHRSRRRRGCG
jgi:hypothetical protein